MYKDWQGRWRMTIVKRVGTTQVTGENGIRWSLRTGREIGQGMYRSHLYAATPERIKAAQNEEEMIRISSMLNRQRWDGCQLSILRKVERLLTSTGTSEETSPPRGWSIDVDSRWPDTLIRLNEDDVQGRDRIDDPPRAAWIRKRQDGERVLECVIPGGRYVPCPEDVTRWLLDHCPPRT